ncbi:NAD(P)H-hydrate dehydratase [Alteromonas lipotrueiana]|uniref:NAD(P)H-hydrate dehydratase n=1 Tax=Alteromonas lipotrueiana TaxID=2803815 RepID=UPI001C441E5A|nr:NAD(P)H-hydrate dehydratase [Alteromonas lipotrueiana]
MLDTQLSSSLSHKLFRADAVRDNEQQAASESSVTLLTLMERAGEAIFRQCDSAYPKATQILVLVGQGNNAGDGYIAALCAQQAGRKVTVCAVEPERQLEGDAGEAQQRWTKAGNSVCGFSDTVLQNADLVIDALLGTGINTYIRNEFAQIIDALNHHDVPVVSVDVPSGIDANTGHALGGCVQADMTVTLVGIKPGLTTGVGKQSCGQLVYDDLGVGEAFAKLARPYATWLDIRQFSSLGPRDVHSHKGSYGRLLCVGGNKGTAGAIRLSGEAALRSGAGMVRAYVHEKSIIQVSAGRPELMVTSEGLSDALQWASCVVIGPGLGQDEWAQQTFTQVLKHCQSEDKPIVLDADALNLLGQQASAYTLEHSILTPHAGEAARLLGVSVDDVESDRFNYAKQCAQRYHATCVLKGAGTIIDDEDSVAVCRHGNPGMATAGSGDVLSGILGALLAQGMSLDIASRYGVTLHAKAGDDLAGLYGQRGMLASDLFDAVRALINQ